MARSTRRLWPTEHRLPASGHPPRGHAATWPHGEVPQQLHLDLTVTTIGALENQHSWATALDARLLLDRSDDVQEPLRVYADPAGGHPFCIFVAPA
ncbi:hypothetical protein K6U06_22615 [Acidiferrimicrobium sp. IK]|nr:VOC family protein [Acidiferrimicrobium sp. IK]MCU4187173.1 hypothetical protein [Acidiferrimicrobium sp. IK]